MNRVAEVLQHAGMSDAEAEHKERLFKKLQLAARNLRVDPLAHAFFVPGRIEVLGKHTDYAGGRSLLCCVERGFCVLAAAREDQTLRFVDVAAGEQCEFSFDSTANPLQPAWASYPATVARRMADNFPFSKRGADVLFASDLPPASGMSSSSALVIASFLALATLNQLSDVDSYLRNIHSQEDLATYLGCVENGSSFGELMGDRGVGTFGGSEDHTAILCCEAGKISQFSFCPTRFERSLNLPKELTFALAVSGVVAEKTRDALVKYNLRSLAIRSIMERWNRATGRGDASLAAALASSHRAANELRKILSQESIESDFPLLERFEQFAAESNSIIPQAADAIAHCDWKGFDDFVSQSQKNAELLLKNQIEETVFLARAAREQGALAASAFGAGFGGSVWALLNQKTAAEFVRMWSTLYRNRFAGRTAATFFLSRPAPAAINLSSSLPAEWWGLTIKPSP